MKATGIVRRIDDLGRLVIPKEIRKLYQMKEGDSIEFYVNDNKEIIIKKFQHLSEQNNQISDMLYSFQELFKCSLLFYGDDRLTSIAPLNSKMISRRTVSQIKSYTAETVSSILLFENDPTLYTITLFPLIIDSAWLGTFILVSDSVNDNMKNVIHSFLRMLSRQIQQ